MTRKVLLALGVASAALVLAGGAGAASDQLRLRPAAGVSYPDRAYVLTLPTESYIDSSSVKVRENGIVMRDVSVVPATAAATGQFGYVLVIDASNSMRGSAIDGAVAAARAFAAHRTGSQVVGIVVFNRTTRVALPFSSDSAAITGALEKAMRVGNYA